MQQNVLCVRDAMATSQISTKTAQHFVRKTFSGEGNEQTIAQNLPKHAI